MQIQNPRLRLVLAKHRRRIAAALVVLAAALLLLAGWTALAPAAEPVTEETDRRTVETTLRHGAVVQSDDAPWARGTELRDHPAYLLNASPALDLTAETAAPPGTTVEHDVRLELVVRREGQPVWQETRPLAHGEHAVDDSGTVQTNATLDVAAAAERIRAAERQFAGVGGVDARIVVDTRYETGGHQNAISGSAPLSVGGEFYWLSGDAAASEVHVEERTIERDAPVPWSQVFLLLVLAGLAGGGARVVWRHEDDADLDALRLERDRERFDEWISRGSIPLDVGRDYVSMDALPDLVDVAIDGGTRVVHDERRGLFAVIDGDVVYFYAQEGSWAAVGDRTGHGEGLPDALAGAAGDGWADGDADRADGSGDPDDGSDGPAVAESDGE